MGRQASSGSQSRHQKPGPPPRRTKWNRDRQSDAAVADILEHAAWYETQADYKLVNVLRMPLKRSHGFFVFLFALLSLFAYSLPPQSGDAGELLKRVVANLKANDLKAQNYTFVEDHHNVNYDKNGKVKVDETAKYETVFIEGTPYKRKLEENGKPLSGKAAAEEEKRYQATVAERRRMNAEQKQTLFRREYRITSIPQDWPDLFLASTGGEEIIDGHEVIKLILTPRAGVKPASDSQKDSLHTSIQPWVDKTDEIPLRTRTEYTGDGAHILRGGTVELFWRRSRPTGLICWSIP